LLKGKLEEYRREIAHLKKDVAVLQKKKEEETFVAKSEYGRLEKELQKVQKELERAQRENEPRA
ncbi:MAG: hypothetical protein K8I00_06875, partial [Candidatus Omnitrophica bacterium]|nr:hypothetical protein [Candidatus Omnitrophota bacterium]